MGTEVSVYFWHEDERAASMITEEMLAALLDAYDVVIGARVQLLGRDIRRNRARHYVGRVFATVVSLALGMPVYDTQCGAKLFRVTPELRSVLARPFLSRWIFDVELIARMVRERRQSGGPPVEQSSYELPLMKWTDVPGSKLRGADFFTAAWDLGQIYWNVLRPGAKPGEPHA